MKVKIETRRMTSIFTGLTFSVVAITGVLMFFHVKSGTIAGLHEWLGIVFLSAVAVHLTINWRALVSYLNHRAFWLCLVVVAMICALVLTLPNDRGRGRGRGYQTGYGQTINR